MNDQPLKVSKLVDFPTAPKAETWLRELTDVIDKGREDEILGTFVGFVVTEGGEDAYNIGNIDIDDMGGVYVVLGAIEELKHRILRKLKRDW